MKIDISKPKFTPIELNMTLTSRAEAQVLYELGNHSSVVITELMERCGDDTKLDAHVAEEMLDAFFDALDGYNHD